MSADDEKRRLLQQWSDTGEAVVDIAARDTAALRAEVERLTRLVNDNERDGLAAVAAVLDANDVLLRRAEAAESALATAQKRVGEIERLAKPVAARGRKGLFAWSDLDALADYFERATLTTKESDNG